MLKTFRLSDAARQKLLTLKSDDTGNAFVPTLHWANSATITSGGEVKTSDGEILCVGQYSKVKLDKVGAKTLDIDGVELVIEPWWYERLEGKTLDFKDGKFVLLD